MKRSVVAVVWIALALPAVYQLVLVITAIAGRLAYPYDLEWMEGGMLHHALRIETGQGIYVPPSIDFIPYLYTPLYPTLLAALGEVFGISYALGRLISTLSLVGIAVTAIVSLARIRLSSAEISRPHILPRWCGAVLALGLFASAYPYVDGWYDLARADTLFLFIATAGIAALPHLATTGRGVAGHARVAVGAAALVLAFFCKQTGIFYVALGGAVVAVANWRRSATFVVVAGVLGLGISAILNATSHGWFWIYVSKIHRAHDFSMARFWSSFGNILWHFPTATIAVAGALSAVAITTAMRKPLPAGTGTFLLWTAAFAISTVVGAVGWATEFAHFNAYMPAFLHGALAAGAAIPVVAGCAAAWRDDARLSHAVAAIAAIAIGYPCLHERWNPRHWSPTPRDVQAGERLIQHIAGLEGDVWVPSHPWYAELAGKTPHVHRMGIKDVTTRQTRTVTGLDNALANHQFSAIVMDDRDLFLELPQLTANYQLAHTLSDDERPRLYSGARIVPNSIWVPAQSTQRPLDDSGPSP